MKNRIQIVATYLITIEIDYENDVVKDYIDEEELINHSASYRFSSVLPVIESGGVKFIDAELLKVIKNGSDIINAAQSADSILESPRDREIPGEGESLFFRFLR